MDPPGTNSKKIFKDSSSLAVPRYLQQYLDVKDSLIASPLLPAPGCVPIMFEILNLIKYYLNPSK
ncbi:hypothetical protein Hanom_Chr12g01077811 [Helianthus anomalus]